MAKDVMLRNRAPERLFHPIAYDAVIGLIALFAISAWILFARRVDIALPLAMVTLFFSVAVAIPWILWRVWLRGRRSASGQASGTFRDWISGQISVCDSQLKGLHALIDMLLPLAAVAFGLLGIGIVFALSGSW